MRDKWGVVAERKAGVSVSTTAVKHPEPHHPSIDSPSPCMSVWVRVVGQKWNSGQHPRPSRRSVAIHPRT